MLALIAIIIQGMLSTSFALRSDGTYQDDELRHYLFARAVRHDWRCAIDVWARPGFTLLAIGPANVGSISTGFMGCRVLAVLLTVLTSAAAYLTARRMRAPLPWLVPWLLLLMPIWMGVSFTPTTEMAAALYLTIGTWQLAMGNRRWAALALAMLPVTRHELIVLLLPLGIYFLWRREFIACALLGSAEIAWNFLALLAGTEIPIHRFLKEHRQEFLGTGNALHYFNRWCEMGGLAIVGLTLAGAAIIVLHDARHRRRLLAEGAAGRRARVRWLVAGGAVGIVALQTLLYQFNRFASGGYSRFLVPIAPWMAIVSVFAISTFLNGRRPFVLLITAATLIAACYSHSWTEMNFTLNQIAAGLVVLAILWRSRMTAAAALLALFLVNAYQWRNDVHAYPLQPHQKLIETTLTELHHDFPTARIVGASPWLKYFQNESMEETEADARQRWAKDDPPGLLYVYDQSHAMAVPFEWFTAFPHRLVEEHFVSEDDEEPYLRVLQRLSR